MVTVARRALPGLGRQVAIRRLRIVNAKRSRSSSGGRTVELERSQRMFQHRLGWKVSRLVLLGVLSTSVPSVIGQTPADNTKVNTRDRAKGAVTADQQKENAGDRKLTQEIRRALMQDKSLSS